MTQFSARIVLSDYKFRPKFATSERLYKEILYQIKVEHPSEVSLSRSSPESPMATGIKSAIDPFEKC